MDAARGSIICETLAELATVIQVLLTNELGVSMVVRVKDRLSEPASGGYRDVMLNVEIEGHVRELTAHTGEINEKFRALSARPLFLCGWWEYRLYYTILD